MHYGRTTPPRVLFAISFTSLVPQGRVLGAAASLRAERLHRYVLGRTREIFASTLAASSRSAALARKHELTVDSVPHCHLAAGH
ncbi:hypothetical protein CVT26_002830 [Gymnopilus dilepis]|uniref:Uncharacterized protein n=1 Tax=Gymnopilus dilepis TaxID=231916 RepID=A0A409Y3C1_9AGAR|nr:hypothetical protein CVT26_002830 [Gymnopilus dilepis]